MFGKKIVFLVALVLLIVFALLFFQPKPQTKMFSHIQALLLHGYWLSQKGTGSVTLSLRGELEVKAAYLLYKNGKTDYLLIPAGSIWGKTYPSLGEVMVKRLAELGVPSKKIILDPTAMDTYEEVTVGVKLAKQYKLQPLGDLAASQHQDVIQQLFKVQHTSATFISYEDVINMYGSAEDKQAIQNLNHSIYSFGFGIYELAVRIIVIVDPKYQLLTNHARATRNHKGPYGGVPILPIDQYEL